MDEALLVGRAMAGDLDSFGQLYDRYFGRVYDFAWRVLHDAETAAAAARDSLLAAQAQLRTLSRPADFRPWLYAIVHRDVMGRAERLPRGGSAPAYEEAFGSFDVPDACRVDNHALLRGDDEIASLTWEAASALSPRDYAILDLHVRQGLDSAEIASIIGASRNNASTLVSRMKSAAADVITGYVVARRGGGGCAQLQQQVAGFAFPPYEDDAREAVEAHIRECAACQAYRMGLPGALAIFGAFAPVQAPLSLKGDVWRTLVERWGDRGFEAAAMPAVAAAGAAPLDNFYGPPPAAAATGGTGAGGGGFGGIALGGTPDFDRRRVLWFVGAAAAMIVFAFVAGFAILSAMGGDGGGRAAPPPSTPAATRTPTVIATIPGVAVQTATPNLTPSVTPAPSETPTPVATSTPPPPAPTSTPVPADTATPTPRTTPAASATPTPKGKPTPTPSPTPKH